MPQVERTQNIIAFLKWLRDVQSEATRGQCVSFIKTEVTEMGATEKTAVNYIVDCAHYGLIEEKRGRFRITEAGKKWLERHSH